MFMWYVLLSLSCDGMERIIENQTNEIYTKLFRNDKYDVDSSRSIHTQQIKHLHIYELNDKNMNFM